jgi:hypothetical protein
MRFNQHPEPKVFLAGWWTGSKEFSIVWKPSLRQSFSGTKKPGVPMIGRPPGSA